jgi:ABC-type uncharacterized transport system auxiliary subunit
MTTRLTAAMAAIPFAALILSACVSEKAYEQQTSQLQQAQAQSEAEAEQAQIAKMQQENSGSWRVTSCSRRAAIS